VLAAKMPVFCPRLQTSLVRSHKDRLESYGVPLQVRTHVDSDQRTLSEGAHF
jgi:hypothetical protein